MGSAGKSVLILAQEGAEVEPVLAAWQQRREDPGVLVLQQAQGETVSEFKRRLHTRLACLEEGGPGVTRSAFVAKGGFGLHDVLATATLLSSLVATMVAGGAGRVYLCGRPGDAQATYALEALADAMRDQVRGTGVEVMTHLQPGTGWDPPVSGHDAHV